MIRNFVFAAGLSLVLLARAATGAAETQTACAYLASLIPATGGPLFLPSYPTVESGSTHNVAFLYDDAAAVIALVGCGEAARARRIGDAILAGLDHDRAWHDGRLRNGYAAGPVDQFPVKLGGWWDTGQNRWLEDGYQAGSASGDMAWAVLALLALDRGAENRRWRDGAIRIGSWLAAQADARGAGGFTGGFLGWEPTPTPQLWKSTEQNTDIAAAFALLFQATGDSIWAERSHQAAQFVAAMWDPDRACFSAGAAADGVTRNPLVALDAQVWPLLALPGPVKSRSEIVFAAMARTLAADGGYSYSEADRGLWTEGTAQAALLERLLGHDAEAVSLEAVIDTQRAPLGGYYATAKPRLATGFIDPATGTELRYYYRLPHLAAAAWAALAEQGYNPFVLRAGLP